MMKDCKICGISDLKTLSFIINHPHAPRYIGFICNYKKSKRYVEYGKLEKLLTIDKKNSKFVAVLVKPNKKTLEKIKNLPFDYYQIYDSSLEELKLIRKKYKKKIIVALTVSSKLDVNKYSLYKEVADILLFDSKGYEKSMSFNHTFIKNIQFNKKIMIAGNIQLNDDLEKLIKIADIIDISGGLETSGKKDISKIEVFLKKIKNLNNET